MNPELKAILPQIAAAWDVPTLRAELLELIRPERIDSAIANAAYEEINARLDAIPPEAVSDADARAWVEANDRRWRAWAAWLKTQPPPADDADEDAA